MTATLSDLEKALTTAPVMGQFHPLVPLCLPESLEVIFNPQELAEELDSLQPHRERPILITQPSAKFAHRFISMDYLACPPAEIINRNLPRRIEAARANLLSNHRIVDRITADVRTQNYQTVILLLVDGLSYADTVSWTEKVDPCFIDGPSITFSRLPDGNINPNVGFPAIIGTPTLGRRLFDLGLTRSRGFSYWKREQNDVSEKLFQGIPLDRVGGLADAFAELERLDLRGFYIQLVREGLDGLAHSRREVSQYEINAATAAIHQDLRYLVELLTKQKVYGAVYLVADHGILWKKQHKWQIIEGSQSTSPRYMSNNPHKPELTTRIAAQGQDFYLWHYPYLGRKIKANDSGVHGGLSYWESIVPFTRVEVNK